MLSQQLRSLSCIEPSSNALELVLIKSLVFILCPSSYFFSALAVVALLHQQLLFVPYQNLFFFSVTIAVVVFGQKLLLSTNNSCSCLAQQLILKEYHLILFGQQLFLSINNISCLASNCYLNSTNNCSCLAQQLLLKQHHLIFCVWSSVKLPCNTSVVVMFGQQLKCLAISLTLVCISSCWSLSVTSAVNKRVTPIVVGKGTHQQLKFMNPPVDVQLLFLVQQLF